jgi:hypothetical protein
MQKKIAIAFGAVFVVVGIPGSFLRSPQMASCSGCLP